MRLTLPFTLTLRKITPALLLFTFLSTCVSAPSAQTDPTVETLRELADTWHRAAAQADSAIFFDAMAEDSHYLGTDPGEHWTKQEFLAFAGPYFARGKAWAFRAEERHVFHEPGSDVAWWDEVLDTWMGPCRGTAVVHRNADGDWKIKHYTLSMLVPNDKVQQVIKAIDQ